MNQNKNELVRHGRKAVVALFLSLAGATAGAQVTYTPMPLDQGFGALDTSTPSVPPEQIITRFASKESEFRKALDNYVYHRTVRVQTVDDDGKVDGEYFQETDIAFDPANGKRLEQPLRLRFAAAHLMSPRIFRTSNSGFLSYSRPKTSASADVTYVGKQRSTNSILRFRRVSRSDRKAQTLPRARSGRCAGLSDRCD